MTNNMQHILRVIGYAKRSARGFTRPLEKTVAPRGSKQFMSRFLRGLTLFLSSPHLRRRKTTTVFFSAGFTPLEKTPIDFSRGSRTFSLTGFTLIETFVAVTILITSIVGPLSIAAQGLVTAKAASDQAIALYLAQDGMEYVHYVRDSNQLGGVNWLTNLTPCVSTNGTAACYFDSTQAASSGNILACSGACPVMNYSNLSLGGTGFYNYGAPSASNIQSKFTRTVSVTFPVGTNDCVGQDGCEAAVSVVINWMGGSVARSVTLREDLFKWQR